MSLFEMFITVCFNLLRNEAENKDPLLSTSLPTVDSLEETQKELGEIKQVLSQFDNMVNREMEMPNLQDYGGGDNL